MSKICVYINSIEKHINEFEIGYMVNPILNVKKESREQVDKFSKDEFCPSTMSGIRNVNIKYYVCYCTSNVL